jgi:cold shock CspA family protein
MSENVATDVPVPQPLTFSAVGKTIGRVKWFNNKVGYGFITTCEDQSSDVFVHHSQIQVSTQQYKYLVEGEYVHFKLSDSSNTDHKHLATEVSGIYGGKLMCETRNIQQEARASMEGADDRSHRPRGGRSSAPNGGRRHYNSSRGNVESGGGESTHQEV